VLTELCEMKLKALYKRIYKQKMAEIKAKFDRGV